MNVDRNLIEHWAMLFESEEARKNGEESFLDEEDSPSGDFDIQDGVLVKYKGMGGDVEIPGGVMEIGDQAFYERGGIRSVTIPDGVRSIGEWAFFRCTNLQSVTIPSSVTSIGNYVFERCSNLKNLVFQGMTEDEVKKMDNYPWEIKNPESVIKCEP